jgi:hypothetical protein
MFLSLWSNDVISIFLRFLTLPIIHFSYDVYVTKFKGCVVISVLPWLISSYIYREVLIVVDLFTNMPFTATGAPPVARRIRVLPMNQYAFCPITLRMK